MIGEMIIQALYFFLPAYVANMMPVFLMKVPILDVAVSKKYFGKNKSWRGVVGAIFAGGVVFWIQKLLFVNGFTEWAIIDYADYSILLGVLLGLGAILGDLVESYYKRKAGIAPGKPWFPFDQLDFVFGGITLSFFVYVPPARFIVVLFVITPLLHIMTNHVGYWLKLRDVKF